MAQRQHFGQPDCFVFSFQVQSFPPVWVRFVSDFPKCAELQRAATGTQLDQIAPKRWAFCGTSSPIFGARRRRSWIDPCLSWRHANQKVSSHSQKGPTSLRHFFAVSRISQKATAQGNSNAFRIWAVAMLRVVTLVGCFSSQDFCCSTPCHLELCFSLDPGVFGAETTLIFFAVGGGSMGPSFLTNPRV